MEFILWTLVWFGLHEIMWWRQFKYRTQADIEKSSSSIIATFVITWVLYIVLYIKFIQ